MPISATTTSLDPDKIPILLQYLKDKELDLDELIADKDFLREVLEAFYENAERYGLYEVPLDKMAWIPPNSTPIEAGLLKPWRWKPEEVVIVPLQPGLYTRGAFDLHRSGEFGDLVPLNASFLDFISSNRELVRNTDWRDRFSVLVCFGTLYQNRDGYLAYRKLVMEPGFDLLSWRTEDALFSQTLGERAGAAFLKPGVLGE